MKTRFISILLFLLLAGVASALDYQITAFNRNVGTTSVFYECRFELDNPTTYDPIEYVTCTFSGTAGASPQVIHVPLIQRTFPFYGRPQYRFSAGGSWSNANSGGDVTATTYTPSPVITSASTKTGSVGLPLSYTITATNSPSSYNATGLPAGLSRSGAVISGTPTTAGTTSATISATNAGGTGSAGLSITISHSQYSANFQVCNTTAAAAIFTVHHWYLTDPDDVSKQHSIDLPLGPGECTMVHLKESYPFVYSVQRQDQEVQVDGSGVIPEPVEVVEPTDSDITSVEFEPESSVAVEAQGVPAPTPAAGTTLPNPTPTTIAQADANDTARGTDARHDAAMIAGSTTGTTNAVNSMSAKMASAIESLKGASGAATPSEGDLEEDKAGAMDDVGEMFDKVGDVTNELVGMVGDLSFSLPSGEPAFDIPVTFPFAPTLHIQSNASMDSIMVWIRGMFAALISFYGVIGIVRQAREMVAG